MNNKKKLFIGVAALGVLGMVGAGIAGLNLNKAVETKASPVDYSNKIRVYVDLEWDNIDYVRVGGDQVANNAVLTSSDATEYKASYGKFVKDITAGELYERMGLFFSQSGKWWFYQYDSGYIWIDSTKFVPGYEFKIDGIGYVADVGSDKSFRATPHRLGRIGQDEAEAWAEDFVENVGCSPTYNAAPTNWDAMATKYDALTKAAKSYLAGLTGSNDGGASDAEKAVFMYDMAISKYSIDNFMEDYRTPAMLVSPAMSVDNNSVPSIVIVAGAITVAAAAGGFFFLRRRKENN